MQKKIIILVMLLSFFVCLPVFAQQEQFNSNFVVGVKSTQLENIFHNAMMKKIGDGQHFGFNPNLVSFDGTDNKSGNRAYNFRAVIIKFSDDSVRNPSIPDTIQFTEYKFRYVEKYKWVFVLPLLSVSTNGNFVVTTPYRSLNNASQEAKKGTELYKFVEELYQGAKKGLLPNQIENPVF